MVHLYSSSFVSIRIRVLMPRIHVKAEWAWQTACNPSVQDMDREFLEQVARQTHWHGKLWFGRKTFNKYNQE